MINTGNFENLAGWHYRVDYGLRLAFDCRESEREFQEFEEEESCEILNGFCRFCRRCSQGSFKWEILLQ